MSEKLRPAERILRTIRAYAKNKSHTTNNSPTYSANLILDQIERLKKVLDNGTYEEQFINDTMNEVWSLYEVAQKSCDYSGDFDDSHGRIVYYGDDFDQVADALTTHDDGCYHTPARGSGD